MPIETKPCSIGDWWIIIPEASTNYVLNSSAEITANFAARNAATVTRVTTYQYRGLYAYRCITAASDEGIELTLSALTNAVHYISLQARGHFPPVWQWSLDNANWHVPKLLKTDNGWLYYGAVIPAAQANGSTTLRIRQSGAGSGDVYLDTVQVEAHPWPTTYADGDQPGCVWNGAVHASTSTRSTQSRAGGRVWRINEHYDVAITTVDGHGMAPLSHNTLGQGLLPGALLQSIKTQPRILQLNLIPPAVQTKDMHHLRKGLIDAFKPDAVKMETGDKPQALRLRYTGAEKELEIECHYAGGLEGHFEQHASEAIPLKLAAYDDPYFHELPHAASALTSKLSVADADYAVKKVAGVWSNISTEFNGSVRAITYNPIDGCIYIGGDFTNVGDANGDYIVKYNPNTAAITSLGTGMDAAVYSIAVNADGDVYVGGNFTAAGGVANTGYVAYWDGAAWNALGAGVSGTWNRAYALCFDRSGALYIGGNFINNFDANGDHITKWDGAAFSSLSTGLNSFCYAIKLKLDGSLVIGGAFTTAGGTTVNGVTTWSGTAFSAMGSGLSTAQAVFSIAVAPNGDIYAGGSFNGGTIEWLARWNGSLWVEFGDLNSSAEYLAFDNNGLLYVGGVFTSAGGVAITDRIFTWNGTTVMPVDLDFPGAPSVYAIAFTTINNDAYFGYSTSGTAVSSALTTVTNPGSTGAYPKFVFKRSGGTSATVQWIKNETTGKLLRINYALLDGETLTIVLSPGIKSVTSNFYGDVMGRTLLRSSDFAGWSLLPGANDVSVYVSDAGAPTVTCFCEYTVKHWSADGGAM